MSIFSTVGGWLGGVGKGIAGPAATYDGPTTANPDDYKWQGDPNAQQRFQDQQAAALSQQAQAIDTTQADADYQRSLQDRSAQSALASQYQGVINGTAGPSVAALQQAQGLQQAQQNAAQQAASARGPSAMAAGRAAALGSAVAGQQAAASASFLRAQETEQARAGLAGVYSQQEQADAAMRNQSFGQAQQAVANQQAQQGLNTQLAGTYLGGELHAADSQTQGAQTGAAAQLAAQQHAADQNMNAKIEQQKAASAATGSVLSSIAGGAGAFAGI